MLVRLVLRPPFDATARFDVFGLIHARENGAALVMRKADGKRLTSQDGAFLSRALFPVDQPRRVEFYKLELAPGSEESAPPPPARHHREPRRVIRFGRDRHETSCNAWTPATPSFPGRRPPLLPPPAVMYLVMTYGEDVG